MAVIIKLNAREVHLIISVSLKSSYLVPFPSDIINWTLGELRKPFGTLDLACLLGTGGNKLVVSFLPVSVFSVIR